MSIHLSLDDYFFDQIKKYSRTLHIYFLFALECLEFLFAQLGENIDSSEKHFSELIFDILSSLLPSARLDPYKCQVSQFFVNVVP